MKTALCALLVVMVSAGASVEAQEVSCILKNTCKPLPCEFLNELKLAKASARIFKNTRVRSDESKGMSFGLRTFDPLLKAFRRYSARCPVRTMPPVHGYGSVTDDNFSCQIGANDAEGKFQPMSRAEFRAASESCAEIEEAQYDRAEVQSLGCQNRSSGKIAYSDESSRFYALEAEQKKIASLEASLLQYLSSCTPDAQLSRQLSEMGLNALRKQGRKNRREWQAKRAQAAGSTP